MVRKPVIKAAHTAKNFKYDKKPHGQKAEYLDQRFKRHHRHQPLVVFAIGAENSGEQGYHHAVNQRQELAQAELGKRRAECFVVAAGEQMHGVGDRLNLQRKQRRHGHKHYQRHHTADGMTVIAEYQQIRHGVHLEAPRQLH